MEHRKEAESREEESLKKLHEDRLGQGVRTRLVNGWGPNDKPSVREKHPLSEEFSKGNYVHPTGWS